MKKVKETVVIPLIDRVFIIPNPTESKTASGIIIPDSAKEKAVIGKVISVGAGKKDEPMTVKSGDMVLYGKYSGSDLVVDTKEHIIMRESEIYAIVGAKMQVKTIKLLADRVLIKRVDSESVTASGIIIPDTAKEKQAKGLVVRVGKNTAKLVKEGESILFGSMGGNAVEIEGTEYLIMREVEIFAITK